MPKTVTYTPDRKERRDVKRVVKARRKQERAAQKASAKEHKAAHKEVVAQAKAAEKAELASQKAAIKSQAAEDKAKRDHKKDTSKTLRHLDFRPRTVLVIKPPAPSDYVDVSKPVEDQLGLLKAYRPAFSELMPHTYSTQKVADTLASWTNPDNWRFSPHAGDVVQIGHKLYLFDGTALVHLKHVGSAIEPMPEKKLELVRS